MEQSAEAAPHCNLLECAALVVEEKGLFGKTQKSPVLMVNFGGDVWVCIARLKFVNFSFVRRFADLRRLWIRRKVSL